jgi:hypothetical protein
MRLQLVILLAVGVSLPSSSRAQESERELVEAAAQVLVYSDDDATTVTTAIVDVDATLPANVTLGAHALVDAVSSASVDVVSAATERWQENRVEVGGRGAVSLSQVDLSVGYTHSQENDWLSHAVALGASRELFQRNTRLSIGYGLTLNTVGRAMDPNFERSIDSHSAEVGVSQLLDPKTRLGGAYTLQYLKGFLSSPYRYVVAADGTRVPERHPDRRIRHALSGYVVRSLHRYLSGRIGYRFYADDWGVFSHTGSLRLAAEPLPWMVVGVEGRGYVQNRADFFLGQYQTSHRYMSFDRELANFWDAGASTDIAATWGPVTATAKVGFIYYRFKNFPALEKRTALVAGGGLKAVY